LKQVQQNIKPTSPRYAKQQLQAAGPKNQKQQSVHKKSNSLVNSKIADIINGL
jgi:hypothetical protein